MCLVQQLHAEQMHKHEQQVQTIPATQLPSKYAVHLGHSCLPSTQGLLGMLARGGALYHSLATYPGEGQAVAASCCLDTDIPAYIPDKDTAIARSSHHMLTIRGEFFEAGGAPNGAHAECRRRRSESLLHFKGLWIERLQEVVFATRQHCPCTA